MGKLNLRTKKVFLKNVKNISVLNVAFSKSVLVFIKKMGVFKEIKCAVVSVLCIR